MPGMTHARHEHLPPPSAALSFCGRAGVTPPCNERESPHGVTSPSPHISHGQELPHPVVLTWCCLLPHLGRGWVLLDFLFLHFASKAGDFVDWKALLLLIEERSLLERGEERKGRTISPCFSFFKIFGVQWQPTSRSQYVVKDNLLHSVLAEESHVVSPALRSTTGIKISSR